MKYKEPSVKQSVSEDSECPYEKWEVEGWVRSICEAEEVKADPEKMKYVLPLINEKVKSMDAVKKSISSIDDIRKIAKDKMSDSEE